MVASLYLQLNDLILQNGNIYENAAPVEIASVSAAHVVTILNITVSSFELFA